MKSYRPFVWICVSFILGITANEYFDVCFALFSFLGLLFLLFSLFFRHSRIITMFIFLAIFCASAAYAKNFEIVHEKHINHLAYTYRKNPLLLEGVVISDVEPRPFFKGTKLVFELSVKRLRSQWGWKERQGTILVNSFRKEDVQYGDYISIEGKMHRPFDFAENSHFSYRNYLRRHGIKFILSVKKNGHVKILKRNQGNLIKSWSLKLKQKLSDILRSNLPDEAVGIMQAFLLGDRYNIPKSVYDLFRVSGVAHIVAISGFHIGIVTYMIMIILRIFPIPRAAQYILAMVFLVLYAFMTGSHPSAIRATIMAIVFLASFLLERENETINALAIAALILLLINPLNLFDVGFQLSFLSVLFIILFYPLIMDFFYKLAPGLTEKNYPSVQKRTPRAIQLQIARFALQSVAVSVAAYLGVGVLATYYFQIITPIVIIANLIVMPIASWIIFLGMGLLIVGLLAPFLAYAFAGCLIVSLNVMIVIVFLCVQIPGAYFQIKNFPLWGVFLYYGIMVLMLFIHHARTEKSLNPP
ncbi:MAG TPA: ComEC/Rec2 family competence protein [Candidatus Omnitrophota bacterium]|nr:ComEC/Rec2 family competence protein [Candidatus Omnitrophota bacterium]